MKAKLLFPKPLENSRKQPKPLVATKSDKRVLFRDYKNPDKNHFHEQRVLFRDYKRAPKPSDKNKNSQYLSSCFLETVSAQENCPFSKSNYHYHKINITIPPTKIVTSPKQKPFSPSKNNLFHIETKFTRPKMSSRPKCNSTILPEQK